MPFQAGLNPPNVPRLVTGAFKIRRVPFCKNPLMGASSALYLHARLSATSSRVPRIVSSVIGRNGPNAVRAVEVAFRYVLAQYRKMQRLVASSAPCSRRNRRAMSNRVLVPDGALATGVIVRVLVVAVCSSARYHAMPLVGSCARCLPRCKHKLATCRNALLTVKLVPGQTGQHARLRVASVRKASSAPS